MSGVICHAMSNTPSVTIIASGAGDRRVVWEFSHFPPALRSKLSGVMDAIDDFVDDNPGHRLTLTVEEL